MTAAGVFREEGRKTPQSAPVDPPTIDLLGLR